MKLLKIIVVVFIIYVVRRFVQAYQAMKKLQQSDIQEYHEKSPQREDAIQADFEILD